MLALLTIVDLVQNPKCQNENIPLIINNFGFIWWTRNLLQKRAKMCLWICSAPWYPVEQARHNTSALPWATPVPHLVSSSLKIHTLLGFSLTDIHRKQISGPYSWRQAAKAFCSRWAVCSTNPKHSPMQATMKKINSLPARTSTGWHSVGLLNPLYMRCTARQHVPGNSMSSENIIQGEGELTHFLGFPGDQAPGWLLDKRAMMQV